MTVSSTEDGAESAVETEAPDVNAAESSIAEADQGESTLMKAVNTALTGEKEETPASEEPDPKGSDSEESAEDADELSEEDKQHFSERAQRRFRELVDKRKTAEGEVAEVRQELDAVKPKAEQMDRLSGFMHEHGVLPDHLNNALGLTAMINRGDPNALPILENLVAQVRKSVGETLPPELQQQVELGYITEAHAKELHKSKLHASRVEAEAKQVRERSEAERRQTETQTVVHRAVSTADAWSKEQAQSDPDWNLKRDRVTEKMENRLYRLGPEGYPRSEEAVRNLLAEVKQEVEKEIRTFRPAPKSITPGPSGSSVSPRSVAKPASLMDAVNQALEQSE